MILLSGRRSPLLLAWYFGSFLVILTKALRSPLPPTAANSANAVHLRVVHFNDVYKLENLPKFKGFMDSLKNTQEKEGITECICTLGGDFFSPSLLSSIDKGKAMVSSLGYFVDYACLGNHEADHGTAPFQDNVNNFEGTIINSNFPTMPATEKAMPASVTIPLKSRDEKHSRKVTLLGLLESSPNLYLPNAFCPGAVENALSISDCVEEQIQQQSALSDLIIPLTHQDVDRDVALAKDFGCPQKMPIVLGGHDHDLYDVPIPSQDSSQQEQQQQCRVLKAGIDAETAIVVDMVWESDATQSPDVDVQFVDITSLDEEYTDTTLASHIERHEAPVRRLDRTVLKVLESRDLALSSVAIRKQQTTIGSLICTALRKALGADVAVLNAGCIRGNSVYTSCADDNASSSEAALCTVGAQKFFTFADLLQELPYNTEICVVPLPGKVLEDATDYSRNKLGGGEEGGGFLQVCNQMDVVQEPSGRYKILQIRGEPMDPHKIYNVAILHHLIKGMDDIEPLVKYAQENDHKMPPFDATRPAKELVLQVYYREVWLLLGSFDDIDTDGTGEITKAKLGAALAAKFGIDPVDEFVGDTLRTFDSNNDGTVTRTEYEACLHAINRHRFDLSPSDCKGIVQVMDVVKYLNTILEEEGDSDHSLKGVVQMEEFNEGDVVLRQGDHGDFLYFCQEGTIRFVADGKDVGACGPGGSFGELSLLYDSPRAATCVADSKKCKLWRMDRPAFSHLLVEAANRHNQQVMSVTHYISRALQDHQQRKALQQILQLQQKEAGEIIICQGDVDDCLYFCEKGSIQFIANGEEVGCTASGGSFGELALLYDTPRAATCLAITDCLLWKVDRVAFRQLLKLAAATPPKELEYIMELETSSQLGARNCTTLPVQ